MGSRLVRLDDVEVRTLKLSWTKVDGDSCRSRYSGDVGRRSWRCRDAAVGAGQRDNAGCSSRAVVGTRDSGE